jgi:hypothetical protein
MRKTGFPRWPWVLVGLLGIAAILVFFANREDRTVPDSLSYRPSGTHAFRKLLQSYGYKVRSSKSTFSRIGADEIAIGFFPNAKPNFLFDEEEDELPLRPLISRHLRQGGVAVIVQIPENFRTATETARQSGASQIVSGPAKFKVDTPSVWTSWATPFQPLETDTGLWKDANNQSVAWLSNVEGGMALCIENGIPATNRFIDKHDNAAYMVSLINTVAESRRKVVFLEAAYGNIENPSVTSILGPWAVGGWTQITIAFLVLLMAYGIRFGYHYDGREKQRGTKELVDAMAMTLSRTHSARTALRTVYDSADKLIRQRLNLTIDTSIEVRNKMLPDHLVEALNMAENALKTAPPENTVIRVAQILDRQLAEFLGTEKRRTARRRKK